MAIGRRDRSRPPGAGLSRSRRSSGSTLLIAAVMNAVWMPKRAQNQGKSHRPAATKSVVAMIDSNARIPKKSRINPFPFPPPADADPAALEHGSVYRNF